MSVKDGAYSNPIEWQQLHDGAEDSAELELDDAAVDSLKRELHGEVRFDDYNTGAHPPLASACLPASCRIAAIGSNHNPSVRREQAELQHPRATGVGNKDEAAHH